MHWDLNHIELCELAYARKKRALEAEGKVDALLVRQDEMAAELGELQRARDAARELLRAHDLEGVGMPVWRRAKTPRGNQTP